MVNISEWERLSVKEKEALLKEQGKPYNYQPQAWEKAQWTKNRNNEKEKIDSRYKGGAEPGGIPL